MRLFNYSRRIVVVPLVKIETHFFSWLVNVTSSSSNRLEIMVGLKLPAYWLKGEDSSSLNKVIKPWRCY